LSTRKQQNRNIKRKTAMAETIFIPAEAHFIGANIGELKAGLREGPITLIPCRGMSTDRVTTTHG